MDATTSAPPAPSSTDDFAALLTETLREAFGVAFDLWQPGPPWTRWPEAGSPVEAPAADVAGPQLLVALDAAVANAGQPIVRRQADGSFLVTMPFDGPDGQPLVAAAAVSLTTEELLERLAGVSARGLQRFRDLNDSNQALDSYVEQISEDLEGLTYLRRLAEHIGSCDISQSLTSVAEAVLPLLRELIDAKALVFVTTADGPSAGDRSMARVGAPGIWMGARVTDDRTCTELVDCYRQSAAEHPVVKNFSLEGPLPADFPGINNFALAPVAKDEFCIGWLLALNKEPPTGVAGLPPIDAPWALGDDEFGTVEAGLLAAAATMLATHGQNVELFREKEALLIGVVRALINTIDAKDPYTRGHSDRVARISKRIAEELGFHERECETLHLTGLLHDIGKIGVPDDVLLKAGRLTDEEFAKIKEHPQRGQAILKHLDQMSNVLPGVLYHHERIDGRGYPSGLGGEQIPLAARIVSVADAYDAMTSSRSYRSAMPEEKAQAILRDGADSQWDGRVLDAFFRALPDIHEICSDPAAPVQMALPVAEMSNGPTAEPSEIA